MNHNQVPLLLNINNQAPPSEIKNTPGEKRMVNNLAKKPQPALM
jgi:hypothetical protein